MHNAQELLSRWPALEVAKKRARVQESLTLAAGSLTDVFARAAASADRAAAGLWRRDPSAWSADAAVQKDIADRLGWLSSPALMADSLPRLHAFADAVKRDGFTDTVLLGMGGSSLAPEVLRAVVGVGPGWPRFHMLDSTDPAAVRAVDTPPSTTLYLIASKSGGTIEPNVLAAHFKQRLIDGGVARWADHFVAITDPGTSLNRRARSEHFRDVFENPADIGGRYSALSFFGMVPAALMGQDIEELVGWGLAMLAAADPGGSNGVKNPAVALGLAMGAGASAGCDKLTLILPEHLDAFGLWVEQLIAESTGKHGKGVVPIAGEPAAGASTFGRDRLFVRVHEGESTPTPPLAGTEKAAVLDITMPGALGLGAEFVRWEVATAVAGALLGIDPFDQPNVQQAKDATQTLLTRFKANGTLPTPAADRTLPNGTALAVSSAVKNRSRGIDPGEFLTLLGDGDYFALLAYVSPADTALAAALQSFRRAVRDASKVATMFGYGPRYLHSTGQLHKGGPNSGVFLLISAAPQPDLSIPGEPFSFGTLELAQAIGDFNSLDAAGRRAMHAHLPAPNAQLVSELAALLLGRRSA